MIQGLKNRKEKVFIRRTMISLSFRYLESLTTIRGQLITPVLTKKPPDNTLFNNHHPMY